jgi:hypothetical protein
MTALELSKAPALAKKRPPGRVTADIEWIRRMSRSCRQRCSGCSGRRPPSTSAGQETPPPPLALASVLGSTGPPGAGVAARPSRRSARASPGRIEAAAVLLGLCLVESLGLLEPYRATSTPNLVRSDNTVVDYGIGRGRSRDASVNDVLRDIYDAGAEIGIELAPERISSEANQAADAAS